MASGNAPRKNSVVLIALFALILASTSFANTQQPGLKIRLSQSGLNYAANVAMNQLSGRVQNQPIDSQSGRARASVGSVEYNVDNIRVTQFVQPSTSVGLSSSSGLTWSMSNAGVSVRGDWRIKYRLGFSITDRGWFEGHVSGAAISVSASIGTSGSGQPTIHSTGCQCSISGVRVTLHGGASWLYNLFMDSVEGELKRRLQNLICTEARKSIDENAVRELSSLKTKVNIGSSLTLDYSLVSVPAFSSDHIDSFHKGEFFYVGDQSEAPFQPRPLPSDGPQRMVTFWMSEYVVNTALYVMHRQGDLRRTITRDDLPPEDQLMLATTCCKTCMCVGNVLFGVAARFPNSTVELELATVAPPTVAINSSGISININGTVILRARLSNGTLVYMQTLMVQTKSAAIPSFDGSSLRAQVQSMSARVSVVESAIGRFPNAHLDFAINYLLQRKIQPKLNAAAAQGIPLPRVDYVQFVNGGVQLQENAICIFTDIQYVG